MKNIKWFTIYKLEFTDYDTDLKLVSVETEIEKVYKLVDTKNFTINAELESEIRSEYLMIELKNGTRVPNKKYTIEHLNYNFLIISEYDKAPEKQERFPE